MAKEEKANLKQYDRREFLKVAGKTGVMAGAYGTVGGFLGKGYQITKDYLNEKLGYLGNKAADLDEKVEKLSNKNPVKTSKKISEKVNEAYMKIIRRTPEEQESWRKKHNIKTPSHVEKNLEERSKNYEAQPKQEEKTTRRGFLKSVFGIFNKHPTATGSAVGATYGTGKAYVGNTKNRKIKKVQRQSLVLQNELYDLKQQTPKNKQNYEAITKQIEEEAESEQTSLTPGGLEKTFLIVGIIGLLFSMLFSVAKITGNTIYNLNSSKNPLISVIIFLISLTIIFIGRKL